MSQFLKVHGGGLPEGCRDIIRKWDLGSTTMPCKQVTSMFLGSDREESWRFLKSANLLRQVHFLVDCDDAPSGKLVLAQNLTQIAMRRLEIELHQPLSASKDLVDRDSSSGKSSALQKDSECGNFDEEGNGTVADIKAIADCMVSTGYGTECTKIYKLMRKSAVDEGLYWLGIHKYNSSNVGKMSWEERELAIGRWMDSAKVAMHLYFRGERDPCDRLFAALDKIRENCFTEITKEAASTCSDSRNSSQSTLTSLVKLGKSVQATISAFESTIQKDSSKVLVNGGGIHPLTQSVMTFVGSLTSRSGILSDILADHPHPGHPKLPESYFEGSNHDDIPASPVSIRLSWMILILFCKLDLKAELYKDASLSYLFLANNLHFIVRQVSSTNLKYLLGDEWITQHTEKIRQYVFGYESTAWNNVLAMLPTDRKPSEIPHEAAVECIRKFNEAFMAEYRKQTSWIIPDGNLRDEIRESLSKKLTSVQKLLRDAFRIE
ncbi:hypothetical protein MLD38_002609 [Melastoma candidum]|uniref:Uncharacterized protein n=1 Tax=Melastoma candidum TaxID=119954 RepID=A0ACB9S3M4_9MYRT|nr:hypothetical protein MLD38_002609 [Melastoma candidum]